MFSTETAIRVRYAETDQMGVVYHSNFFLYFESARAESIRQEEVAVGRFGDTQLAAVPPSLSWPRFVAKPGP